MSAAVDGADQTSTPPKGTDAVDSARIGWAFLSQYYSFLNKDPARLHCFYTKRSTLIHSTEGEDTQACYGQQEIHTKIMSLGFDDCKVYISNVDSQSSAEGGIIVQVIGEMSNANGAWRKFAQTFFLAEQPNGYFVLNDICRYIKEEGDDEAAAATPAAPAQEEAEQQPQADAAPASVQSVLFNNNEAPAASSQAQDAPAAEAAAPEEPTTASADSFTFHGDSLISPPTANGIAEEPTTSSVPEPTPAGPVVEVESSAPEPAPTATEPEAQEKPAPAEEQPAAPAPAEQTSTPAPEPAAAPAAPTPAAAPVAATPPPPPAAAPSAPAAKPSWASLAATNVNRWSQVAATPNKGVSAAAPPAAQNAAPERAPASAAPAAAQPSPSTSGLVDAVLSINTPSCFVKGVVETVSDKALRDTLTSRFGPLKEVDIVRNKACAFIEFERLHDARRAIQTSLRPSEGGEGGIHIEVGPNGQTARINIVERKPHDQRPPAKGRGAGREDGAAGGGAGAGGAPSGRGGRGGGQAGRGGRGGRGGAKGGAANAGGAAGGSQAAK